VITDLIPYQVAGGAAASGSTTLVLTVGSAGGYPVLPGDTIIVCGGGGNVAPTGVTDSQGNTYTLVTSIVSPNAGYVFTATAGTHGLRSDVPDTVTITYAGTGTAKTASVYACAGLLASPVDTAVTATAGGTSASPAVAAAGNPAAAGELVLTLIAAAQPAPPVWAPNWLQLGTQKNAAGTNCWTLACYTPATPAARPPYGPVFAPAASGTLGSSVTWVAVMTALKPATVAQGGMVGLSCWTGSYGGSTRVSNSQNADALVGRKMAMQVQRTYYAEGQYPATVNSPQEFGHLSDAGIFQVVSLRPNRAIGGGTPGERANLAAALALFKNYIAQQGSGNARFACAFWQECNGHSYKGVFGDGSATPAGTSPYGNVTTDAAAAQNFRDYCNYYGPTITAAGIPVAYMPAIYSPGSALTFFPGRPLVNAWCLDYYCRGDWTGNGYALSSPSDTLSQAAGTLAGYTFTPPLPYGLGEWGYADGTALPTDAQFHQWVTGQLIAPLQNFMANGGNLAWLTWFTGGPVNTILPGSATIADIQAAYDALQAAPGGALAVTTTGLPGGVVGTAYSATLTASGGTAPYTWAVTVGTLPAGLSLASSTGVISGTPTTAATSPFTVQATDQVAATATAALSITITATNTTFPVITTTSLPAATTGSAYSQALAETGGTSPFTWAVTSGALPDGLSLDPAAGVISGTPTTAAATSGFTVTITDANALTGSAALFITVAASAAPPSPAALPPMFPQVIIELGVTPAAPVVPAGTLILDDPVYGKLDANKLGDATGWTDITRYVRSGTTARLSTRQQGPLLAYQPGSASAVLRNDDGRFDPDNATGPYAGNLRAMIPFRARAVYASTEYHLFSGFTDSWGTAGTNWGPLYSETTVSATDGFKILAGITIPAVPPGAGSAGAGEDTGARITRILNAAQWYTDHRKIDTGDTVVQGTLFGDTALNLLQLTADNETGVLYIDGSGNLTFRHRHAILTDTRSTTVQAIFGDSPGTVHGALTELPYQAVTRSDDDTQLANDIQATTQGGALQEAQNLSSQRTYLFPRTYARSDLILQDDPTTLEWAQWVLSVSLAGQDRFDQLTVAPLRDPADLFPQVLGREIGDLIQVIRRPPGVAAITKNVFIRGISHTVDVSSNTWQTTWDLEDSSRYAGFLILDSTTNGLLNTGKLAF
jgi:hypothetical protein